MTRAPRDYTTSTAPEQSFGGMDVSQPVEGYFKSKLRFGGAYVGVRFWYGPPHDPVTGEEMDRSWRWQALVNDEPHDFDQAWPRLATEPITEAEYLAMCRQQDWAREHAPTSALADPRRRHDPLTTPINFF